MVWRFSENDSMPILCTDWWFFTLNEQNSSEEESAWDISEQFPCLSTLKPRPSMLDKPVPNTKVTFCPCQWSGTLLGWERETFWELLVLLAWVWIQILLSARRKLPNLFHPLVFVKCLCLYQVGRLEAVHPTPKQTKMFTVHNSMFWSSRFGLECIQQHKQKRLATKMLGIRA